MGVDGSFYAVPVDAKLSTFVYVPEVVLDSETAKGVGFGGTGHRVDNIFALGG